MNPFLSPIRFAKAGLLLAASVLLAGCMAAALAPMVPLVGGMSSSSNKVTVDEATVTPELRHAFADAKRLTLIGGDRSSLHMAEYLDEQQAYEVRIEPSGQMSTPSQRREDMRKVCSHASPPDLVLSSSMGRSDVGTGTTMGALFTGRANFNVRGTIDVLRCRDSWASRFAVAAEISQGMYNADIAKIDQVLGQEIGKSLMVLGGKLPSAGEAAPASGNNTQRTLTPVSAPVPSGTTADPFRGWSMGRQQACLQGTGPCPTGYKR